MNKAIQLLGDIFGITLAATVIGGAYLYNNPGGFNEVWPLLSGLRGFTPTAPSPTVLLVPVTVISMTLTAYLLFRFRRTLLRGPIKIKLLR